MYTIAFYRYVTEPDHRHSICQGAVDLIGLPYHTERIMKDKKEYTSQKAEVDAHEFLTDHYGYVLIYDGHHIAKMDNLKDFWMQLIEQGVVIERHDMR